MIDIKSVEDCSRISDKLRRKSLELFMSLLTEGTYNPEEEGWLCYIEEGDDLRNGLQHVNLYKNSLYEGVLYWELEGLYEIIIVLNNDFCMGYIIPSEIVDEELLDSMHEVGIDRTTNARTRLGIVG
jgi:hypothetical protein